MTDEAHDTRRADAFDRECMTRAIAAAGRVRCITSPNPWVGAVVRTRDGAIYEGATRRPGEAHAEIVALEAAGPDGSGGTLYVTLEPCPMCAGAILQARVPRVVWGAADPKAGAVESLYRLFEDPRLNHRVEHVGRVMADECGGILTEFFRGKRRG